MTSAGRSLDILCRRTNKNMYTYKSRCIRYSKFRGVTPARMFAAREARVLPVEEVVTVALRLWHFIMLMNETDVIWTTSDTLD